MPSTIFTDLGYDILLLLALRFLSVYDVVRLSKTCKYLHQLYLSNPILHDRIIKSKSILLLYNELMCIPDLNNECLLLKIDAILSQKQMLPLHWSINPVINYCFGHIKILNFTDCELEDISFIKFCPELTELNLDIWKYKGLIDMSCFSQWKMLAELWLSYCPYLTNMSGIGECRMLTHLRLCHFTGLTDMFGIHKCNKLTSLELHSCTKLIDISSICECKNLTKLSISFCNYVADLTCLAQCNELTDLNLVKCRRVTDMSCLCHCEKLTNLIINYCEGMTDVSSICMCKNLIELVLTGCMGVTNVSYLVDCNELKYLNLYGTGVTDVSFLYKCKKLITLYIRGCTGLTQENVDYLKKLSKSKIYYNYY